MRLSLSSCFTAVAERTLLILVVAATTPVAACKGVTSTKWQDHMAQWFNNASVQPLEPAASRWTNEDWDLLLRRLGHADLALVGRVEVLTAFRILKTPRQLRLLVRAERVLHGSLRGLADEDGALVLDIQPRDLDFHLALRTQRHVPGQRYLLLAKIEPQPARQRLPGGWQGSLWHRGPAPKKNIRWVLYRPQNEVLTQVLTMYRWLDDR